MLDDCTVLFSRYVTFAKVRCIQCSADAMFATCKFGTCKVLYMQCSVHAAFGTCKVQHIQHLAHATGIYLLHVVFENEVLQRYSFIDIALCL